MDSVSLIIINNNDNSNNIARDEHWFTGRTVYKNGSPYAIGSLSVLSCLSMTLVYCGQTVGWITMKLGLEVGLGPSHAVLDGDPAPPKGAQPPIFGPYQLQPNSRPSHLPLSTCFNECRFSAVRPVCNDHEPCKKG